MTDQWKPLVSDAQLDELFQQYCNDFTALAREGRYDPITGRDREIDETILILLQKGRKNAALLAPAGVGKTALVVGLAQQIVAGNVPDYLKNARVLEIDLARMAAGTTGPAEFQARFIPLCKGVAERYHRKDQPRIILFIDEIHQIMPACTGSSYKGLSDVMKPYLTVGDLLVIGATTLDEFRMYVALDPAMDRRFQKVFLNQPNIEETYRILQALRPGYERHHNVRISNAQLMLIIHLTHEHMRKRNQPDKSIITMDAAMAYHVKEYGIDQEIGLEAIYYMVGRETGLNKAALHDEKKLRQIYKEVRQIEGENGGGAEADIPVYDPAAALKGVEIDKEYQREQKEEEFKKQRKEAEKSATTPPA